VTDRKKDPLTDDLDQYLTNWLNDETSKKHIALLGEYGQGKTSATQVLAHRLINDNAAQRVPVLIELRGKSPKNMTVPELLASWAEPYDINPRALMKLLVSGKLLVIFDGFDEMANVADVRSRVDHFRSLWNLSYPKAKLLFTGRQNLFLGEADFENTVGVGQDGEQGQYCEALYLQRFDKAQMVTALREHDKDMVHEIIELVDTNESFADVIGRPSILHLVSTLWNTPEFQQKKANINSALIIEQFVDVTIQRQVTKERKKPEFMTLDRHEMAYFTMGVAAYMLKHDLANQISRVDLESVIRKLLEHMPESELLEKDSRHVKRDNDVLSVVFSDKEELFDMVFTEVRSYGLLVTDLSRADSFKFAHKSFYELLAAKFAYQRLLSQEDVVAASIVKTIEIECYGIVELPTGVKFLAELMRDSSQLNSLKDIKHLVLDRKGLIDNIFCNDKKINLLMMQKFGGIRRETFEFVLYIMASALVMGFLYMRINGLEELGLINVVSLVFGAIFSLWIVMLLYNVTFWFGQKNMKIKAKLLMNLLLVSDYSDRELESVFSFEVAILIKLKRKGEY
jgi:hypothetical protein